MSEPAAVDYGNTANLSSPKARRPPVARASSLMPRYLELIRSGAKTVEGRIPRQYDSFRAMLEGEGLQACLPGVATLEQGVEVYRSIPGYRQQEAVEGVVAVGVQVLGPAETGV